MKVVFLGTGTSTGIPIIGCHCAVCESKDPKDKRTRTSIYVEQEGTKLVVDTGPDFRAQMLREGIEDIDAVLFTHAHKDHIAGLDDVRPINYLQKKVIDVYANEFTTERLKAEYPYIFGSSYPGIPLINLNLIGTENFQVRSIHVIPLEGMHGKMPVLGFRFGSFSYITDVNFIAEKELEKIKGSKVFVIDALHHKHHYSHFTLEEALEVVKKVNADTTYLIHMSHFMGMHQEVEKDLPQNVHLSYDGLTLNI
ncbi:MAG: MBL fold metallo-hydrolase [Bacteroidetes bacterium]|nr:MBL fold metallo-hydrolase [Bacteroidota bacterium]